MFMMILSFFDCCDLQYVTEHEKTGLMYTKYTSLYYGTYVSPSLFKVL